MDKSKNFLPSKKFITSVLVILVIIGIFFAIRGLFSLLFKKGSGDQSNNSKVEMTVGTIIQKDSNKNGIPDWEEYLWGLDPYKNGPENKEFILSKKRILEKSGIISPYNESASITQNELLSRQFFATIISLQQTGNFNEETIMSISENIGQNIIPESIPDIYTKNMLIISSDSKESNIEYQDSLTDIIENYSDSDLGEELTLIVQGLNLNDPQALYSAITVSNSYESLAEELISIKVPQSIANTHLSLANNYKKVGLTIKELVKMMSDPLMGMRTIINYKKYSEALSLDLEKMSNILQQIVI
jgi:hypothetical protein